MQVTIKSATLEEKIRQIQINFSSANRYFYNLLDTVIKKHLRPIRPLRHTMQFINTAALYPDKIIMGMRSLVCNQIRLDFDR